MSIKREILMLIKSACADDKQITASDKWEDLSIDSLSFVELVVNIEDRFNVSFIDEELSIHNWKTVNDMICAVQGKLKAETK